MRLVSLWKVESGQVLGKPVLGPHGQVLLKAGVSLTPAYVRKLSDINLTYVYIQDSATYDIDVESTITYEVQQEVVAKIESAYSKLTDPTKSKRFIETGELGKYMKPVFELLFDSVMKERRFIINISAIYSSDSYLYTHCMNVGMMACVLGAASGLDERRIRELGFGGMLHDIGKIQVDRNILNKPGQLSDEEYAEVQKHCQYGYEILIHQPDVATTSAHCALQHHERYDGTGYPRQLRGEDIHRFGRILAIPDVYDALISNRVYRPALLPHQAAEYLREQSGAHFDPQLVEMFMKHINLYPNGLPVTLSNGAAGVVAKQNNNSAHHPVVMVLMEENHKITPYEMDLSKETDVTIVAYGE